MQRNSKKAYIGTSDQMMLKGYAVTRGCAVVRAVILGIGFQKRRNLLERWNQVLAVPAMNHRESANR
jgi:hypothetical protein